MRHQNLDAALAHAEQGLAAFKGRRESPWHWRFLLLKAEILSGKGRAADALKLLDHPAPGSPDAELAARLKMQQGYAAFRLNRYQDSLRLLDEALGIAAHVSSPALVAEIQNKRGAPFVLLGRPDEAEQAFRNALEQARRAGDSYLEVSALGNLGSTRLFTERFDEAIVSFEQMLPLARKGGSPRIIGRTLHNLGICYRSLGDIDRALQCYREAEPLYAQAGDVQPNFDLLGDLGNVYMTTRQYERAADSFRKALDFSRKAGNRLYAAEWLNNLAALSIELGDLPAAGSYVRESLAALSKIEQPARDKGMLEPLLNSARIEAARGNSSKAEEMYLRAIAGAPKLGAPRVSLEARARLGSLYVRAGRWDRAGRLLRDLASTIESTRSKLKRDEWKLTFQSSIIPFYEEYVSLLMEKGETVRALEVAESGRARVLAEKLDLAGKPQTVTVAALRNKARALNAILLSFWLAPKQSYLWVVTPSAVRSFTLPPKKEIERLVEACSNLILRMEDLRYSENPAGRQLYQTLLAEAERLIPAGSRVVVVPDGALHGMNLEALVTGGVQPRYWIEDVSLAVAPSLALLDTADARAPAGDSLLLIGDPAASSPEFPRLPESATEIRDIRAQFDPARSTVLTGADARPEEYGRAGPGRFALIHFAAHAVANRESPLDSAVILSGGPDSFKLYARDVARIPLRAELVTISACRGAGARMYAGEGLVGFSWAFLQAGARNVIAGLWDVSDRSTALLMSRLYAEQRQGKGPADALRAAKLSLLAEPAWRRPYYWAPFELFTRAAPFHSAGIGRRVKRSAASAH
ncbi:MAG TPA: CHAT domain-containing protein [Bryobacteraceae bacterium]|nr:CHAT domain-containing protein [Bryobacteraceae bacterium]